MVLDAADVVTLESGDGGMCGRCGGRETVGDLTDAVKVTHPHRLLSGLVDEQATMVVHGEVGATVFAGFVTADRATKLFSDQLSAVTDTQDWYPELVDIRVNSWGTFDVY